MRGIDSTTHLQVEWGDHSSIKVGRSCYKAQEEEPQTQIDNFIVHALQQFKKLAKEKVKKKKGSQKPRANEPKKKQNIMLK